VGGGDAASAPEREQAPRMKSRFEVTGDKDSIGSKNERGKAGPPTRGGSPAEDGCERMASLHTTEEEKEMPLRSTDHALSAAYHCV